MLFEQKHNELALIDLRALRLVWRDQSISSVP